MEWWKYLIIGLIILVGCFITSLYSDKVMVKSRNQGNVVMICGICITTLIASTSIYIFSQ